MFENGCRVYLILLQTVTQALSIYFTVIFLAVQNKVGIANPGSQIDHGSHLCPEDIDGE